MNAYDLLDALGGVDDAYLLSAEMERTKQNKGIWLKWGAVAACICLIFTGTFLFLLPIQKRPDPKETLGIPETEETSAGVETEASAELDGKKPITSIPNAAVVDLSRAELAEGGADGDIYTPEEYTEVLKNHFLTLVGEATNIRSITVRDGEFIWCITTFDIVISQAVSHPVESGIIRCVTAIRCFMDGSPTVDCGISDVGMRILEEPTGFFVTRSVRDDTWKINGKTYALSDYADYYVGCVYSCTDESFSYYGTDIPFDDIRP